jgi:chromosome segregation ATPase
MLEGNRNSRGAGSMVVLTDTISTAKKNLMALHEREEKLKELVETARREHNEAVADRHRAADSDEVATGIDKQIAALRTKFDELADALADATTRREAAEQYYEQLIQTGSAALSADIDQRVGAIQDALASFLSASQDLANKLNRSTPVGADLTSSVFKTAAVLDHEVHGVIGALESAKAEIQQRARNHREPLSLVADAVE